MKLAHMHSYAWSFRKHAFALSALVLMLVSLATPTPAQAQVTVPWSGDCVSVDTDKGGLEGGTEEVATLQGIECVVRNILGIGLTGVGIASFVMLLIGSFLYSTSGGNPKGTDAGSKTITYAFLGIIVAISGIIALNFISIFTGNEDITTFSITGSRPGGGNNGGGPGGR